MKDRFLLPLLLIVVFEFAPCGAASLNAQDFELQDSRRVNRHNLSQFGHETFDFFVQPTKWDGNAGGRKNRWLLRHRLLSRS
jgi:hypothetical protein